MGWSRTLGVLALYAVALGGLLYEVGSRPAYPYNWESYTAWNVWSFWVFPPVPDVAEILALTDGLMTDSGRGPLLGLPVWLGIALDGAGLAAMRWPVALVTALAVPLTWELGRRLVGSPAALLAALLLAVSPVFLLYGRTATLVGISLVPALLTMLALVGVLESTRRRQAIAWLIALQASLMLGAYEYAPVRLLWPLAVAALFGAALRWRTPFREDTRGDRRRVLLIGGLVTLVCLPLFLVAVDWLTTGFWSPPATITGYFQARGEQIFELGADPDRYRPYLREMPAATTDQLGLVWSLISQNVLDSVRLLSDWQTEPLVTEFWNPRGRLWPWLLAPFFWLGLTGLIVGSLGRRSWRQALLLLLLLGLTVPLLFTTRVHVGRLVPALPLLLLTVAWGWSLTCQALTRLAGSLLPPLPVCGFRRGLLASSGLAIVAVSAILSVAGYEHLPADSEESRFTARVAELATNAAEHGGATLVAPSSYGLEVEGVRAAVLWLALNREYRVVDLSKPAALKAGDPRPPLYAVGALSRLAAGQLPNLCGNLYLVLPEAAAEFQKAAGSTAMRERCPAGIQFELLSE